ncbi:MAG TPA: BON domain-containing protein [Oscillatoriaceae cyanobacterium M33_DOE_052]|uniref:BON domain-containing protein n=1 Tax=Planktothricoides sp. SpSt-374 TaxID=2282167 RepID=A0A7C3VSP5_9CYAN|nr:BON domain-containing protein [Oscillatoriaceae cyanobacterium M33_DOE_052]
MGITSFLKRMFGAEPPDVSQQTVIENFTVPAAPQEQGIPPERLGLNGEYDQSGLAKRVALAFDQDPNTGDFERLWVAQTGGTVVLKGEVPTQADLNKLVTIARGVYGATDVNAEQVTITG